ncbi:MAG TPA: branched-chain amino acid ABC transporter permease/ATP-binding protein [Acidimicrobiales bacterium]|nr:branched-chain amino acid ABC transporter permease/ATP-binding protein [Acidimicrobiales bacterium]
MRDSLQFALLGAGAGGIYALLALGIVLVYRGSGVVNFAHGGFALLGAAVFYETRPDIGTPAAMACGVAAGALAGLLTQLLIMRPLRHSSPLTRLIATLGVLLVIQQAALRRYGSNPRFVVAYLPHDAVTPLKDVVVGEDRLLLLAITAALTVVLALIYRMTRFGCATTAVAENERAAAALGWSPGRIAAINWTAGGALAGLAGVLLVPIVGLSAGSLTLTILPALAAALLGGFASFPLTFLGGLAVGIGEAEVTSHVSQPGWSTAVPFLLIIAILMIRGQALPLRSHRADRLPRVGSGRIRVGPAVLGVVVAYLSLALFTVDWSEAMTTTAVLALVGLSLVVVTGYCGQLSLAQYAMAGVGCFIAARLADAASVPVPLAALLGVLLTIPVGLVVALPAVRARGVNLAVATLGLAVVINAVVFGNAKYTGGEIRGTIVPSPRFFGVSFDPTSHADRYAGLAVLLVVLCGLVVANLRRSQTGRRLVAVRGNERAAASLGISVVGMKLYAFGLASAIAAVGGVVLAFRFEHTSFQGFDAFASIQSVLIAVIGGIGYVLGAVVGAFNGAGSIGQVITSHILDLSVWFTLVSGVLLILVILVHRDGVASVIEQRNEVTRAWLRRRLGRPAPQPSTWSAPEVAISRVPPRRLEVQDIVVRFGGVVALDRVSLAVEPGEVVGLIGPNGAGKTTLIDVATGYLRAQEGRVLLDGQDIGGRSVQASVRAGVTRSFQSIELFEDLSIADNLRSASDRPRLRGLFTDLVRPVNPGFSPAAVASIQEFGLGPLLDMHPRDLTYAHRRLAGIARAVATGPSVLLLDEPAAGLDSASSRELGVLIRRLAEEWGMGVLLIEHDVAMVLATCDRVVALDFGRVIATGTPEEIRRDPAVVVAYLGQETPADVGEPTSLTT